MPEREQVLDCNVSFRCFSVQVHDCLTGAILVSCGLRLWAVAVVVRISSNCSYMDMQM